MVDLVAFGETALRLSPTQGEQMETTDRLRLRVSGTESNAAVAAGRAGADATWLSKLPDSPLGRRVAAELRRHGVETEIAWAESGRQTLLFSEPGAAPREGRRIEDRTDGAVATVAPGDLRMDRVQAADAVVVGASTFALGGGAVETGRAVARAGHGTGTVAMVLDHRPELWSAAAARETLDPVFESVDALIATEAGIQTVFDRTGEPRELAHAIASSRGIETVAITRSDGGALAWRNNVIHERDGVECETVDPAGRQAAFAGAFVERSTSGAGIDEALAHGVAAAALAGTVPGAMLTVSGAEIDATAADLLDGR